MARMRSLKPEFWHDQEITRLPRDARLLYMAMWNLADEHSRMQGDPRYIKGQAFPYDDDLTPSVIDALVDQLVSAGKAERYVVRDAVYLYLPKLQKHQRLDADKVPSRLPGPDESTPQSDPRANESGKNPDQGADESALSMLHVAGSKEHVAGVSDPDTATIRDDVTRICDTLADRIESNGARRPTVTQRWRDAARLMLDNDGRTEAEVLGAIEWSQRHEFWRSNILSLPKLREKYDQLKLQAQRSSPPNNSQQATDDMFDRAARRMGVIQ